MTGRRLALSAGVCCALAAACSQPPLPVDHFYRLDPGAPGQVFQSPPLAGVVAIGQFRADGLVSQRPMVYSEAAQPLELLQYNYHYWVESPPDMIELELTDFLRNAGAAEVVDGPETRSNAGCKITGSLRRFERMVGDGRSVISVELDLRLARTNDAGELLFRAYRSDMRAGDDKMVSAVVAFNAGVKHIFDQFLADLASQPFDCPRGLQ